jgi:Alginate export
MFGLSNASENVIRSCDFMKYRIEIVLLALLMALVSGPATAGPNEKATSEGSQTEAVNVSKEDAAKPESPKFLFGGDIRLREVYFDHIPYSNGGESRGGMNHFQRYRTRLWGEYHRNENFMVRTRLVNEFRTYAEPDNNSWNSMDEVVIDNLFFDWKLDDWALRFGRQDLIYGTGKLILDGTPKDGSRTIYFDAVKLTYSGFDSTTVDFLLMSTNAQDPIAMHTEDRDIVGFAGGNAYEGAETGGGVYLKNKSFEKLPFETYYLVKTHEQDVAFLNNNDRHTVGARLMPILAPNLNGNLEVAYQFGNDISAFMIDAKAVLHIASLAKKKARIGLGWYYLSGDDPDTSKDEGWNPLWARWPQYSELYVYAYDTDGAGRWSNVNMPYVDFSISPFKKLKTDLLLGYMWAPEDIGAGGGHDRGLLFTCKNSFTLKEKLLTKKDKLTGHILFEFMEPGNYYTDDQRDHTASFLRAELSYSF